MYKLYFFVFLFNVYFISSYGQTTEILEQNDAAVMLSDNGIFFNDQAIAAAGYEIPKGSDNNTVYSMGLWMTGLDGGGMLHGACNRYEPDVDFFPGPMADDYGSTYYTDNFSSAIWSISKSDIDYHKENYASTGYTPSTSITNWPGNGDASEGVAEQLAPYVDVNSDMVYDPADGDYPYIQGDKAVYVIMNDEAGTHATGLDPLGVEVHLMFYQFAETSGELSETTFMNAKIYNRSTESYNEFRFGLFMDYDLGNYNDDFVGTDSVRNMTYVYNGAASDADYGSNPPAFGAMFLSDSLASSMSGPGTAPGMGDPTTPTHYHNYLRSIWKDGQHLLYGGNGYTSGSTVEVGHIYTGTPSSSVGWSEVNEGHASGDRRMIMSTADMTLDADNYICSDVAFVYSDDGGDHLSNVDNLKTVADNIQTFYADNIQPCSAIFTGIEENFDKNAKVRIFPNPSNGWIKLELKETSEVEIISMNGKRVYETMLTKGISELNLDLRSGLYLLKVTSSDQIFTERLLIRE